MTHASRPPPRPPHVYILASARNGTLYIGVTSDLVKRVWQHKASLVGGFTKRYRVHRLVWYEAHSTMESAVLRERRLKKWNREWKIRLIERSNPHWCDLYDMIVGLEYGWNAPRPASGFPPPRE